jgi:hypothetical protein
VPTEQLAPPLAGVDLYWLPLGAGDKTHCVRTNGRIFEWVAAQYRHRERLDLYHSALEVRTAGGRFIIEMAPVWSADDPDRGVVGEGPVGLGWLGRSRLFRYEVRCWRDGVIPDVALARTFPTATWGRDELDTGDMWNSNSLVSWLLAGSGHDIDAVGPPVHGRAPGWAARARRRRKEPAPCRSAFVKSSYRPVTR